MSNFCHGELWNASESWNTTNPNLSACLRDSICPAIPSVLLWLSTPFWYVFVTNYNSQFKLKYKNGGWTSRLTLNFLIKFTLNAVILVNSGGEYALRLQQAPNGFKVIC